MVTMTKVMWPHLGLQENESTSACRVKESNINDWKRHMLDDPRKSLYKIIYKGKKPKT